MLIGPPERHDTQRPFVRQVPLAELAAEISLGSERSIQFSAYTMDEFDELASWFREQALADAVTVYTSKPNGDFVEAWA